MRTSIIRIRKSKTRVCCSGHDTICLIFSTSFLRKCVSTERRKYKYKIFVASGARERRVVRVAHASGRPSGVQSCSRDGGGLLRRLLIFLLSSFYFVDALFLSPFSFHSWALMEAVWPDWTIFKGIGSKFSHTKVAQYFVQFLGLG